MIIQNLAKKLFLEGSSPKKSIQMELKLNLIAAACKSRGIGINGDLPWRLKSEMAYFTNMTKKTCDPTKRNAVIMGRRTWDCIPLKFRPLAGRLNIVLTRQKLDLGNEATVFNSLEEAIEKLQMPPLSNMVENVWVIGGSSIYETAMKSPNCNRVYLTDVMAEYECDTFFPDIDESKFKLVGDVDVPAEVQEENGIRFKYQVFEKYA